MVNSNQFSNIILVSGPVQTSLSSLDVSERSKMARGDTFVTSLR